MGKTISKIRFYIYGSALLPFFLLLVSGLILLKYHTGESLEETVMGQNGHFWYLIHKITSVVSLIFIILHLFVKTDWVKRFFSLKLKGAFKSANSILFVVFILCSSTGLLAWLVFQGTTTAKTLVGIHNKLGLLLISLFVIHLWNYRKMIIRHFRS